MFNVTGESYRYERISITHNGGTLEVGNLRIQLTPWKHIYWIEKNMDGFFLANVTTTNFYIAFLYFSNGSNRADMILFEYDSALYKRIPFIGTCIVKNSSTVVNKPITSVLTLKPKPKVENKLFATGPDLYLVGDVGYLKLNSSILNLYAIRNTLNPSSGWNELWALLTGQSGEYYFSIIYMNIQSMDKVILGHTLRLNDFYVIKQKEIEAKWRMKQNVYPLTISAPKEVGNFWIDGYQFQFRDSTSTVLIDEGNHTLRIPENQTESQRVRLRFSRWSCGSTSNPLMLSIKSPTTISAEYTKEYFLKVNSTIPGIFGQGWYSEGAEVHIKAPRCVESGNVKHVFESWVGEIDTKGVNVTVFMDAPKSITAKWSTFFRVNLTAEGLPENIDLKYGLDNLTFQSRPYQTIHHWVKEKSLLNFNVSFKDDSLKTQYPTIYWTDSKGNEVKSPKLITAPEKLIARFTTQKQTTNITCRVSLSSLFDTGMLTVEGQMTPPFKAKVAIECRVLGDSWKILKMVETDQAGNYRFDWIPDMMGILQIRARFSGDTLHNECISNIKEVAVSSSMLKFRRWATVFNSSTSTFYEEIGTSKEFRKNFLTPLTYGINVLNTVYPRLSGFGPLGSIIAIVSSSTVLGLFYILPFTIILAILFVIIFKNSITRKVLTPFGIIWGVSFCYLLLEDLNAIQLLQLPAYADMIFTASLAVSTIGITAIVPPIVISKMFAKRLGINT
ncbi:MAG: hypothetical protein QXQ11_08480 [Candidatus Bathyarchaeia archaeon]